MNRVAPGSDVQASIRRLVIDSKRRSTDEHSAPTATASPGYNRLMSEEREGNERVTAIEWLREVLPPITYTLLGAFPFILFHQGPERPPDIFWVFAGALYGACLTRLIVVWINRRDDPSRGPPSEEH